MTESICEPLSKADPQTVIRSGLGITDLRATRGTVCAEVEEPKARLVQLRPVASAYEDWREGLPLDPEYDAVALGWPLRVDLRPGFLLDRESGLPRWEAERAVEGLLAGEARYIELAAGLLLEAKGCILELPGGASAALVKESEFPTCITIGEPLLLFGGGEPGLSLVPQEG